MQVAHDMVLNFGSGEQVIKYYAQHQEGSKQDYMNTFLINKNLILHHPVLDTNCQCVLMEYKKAPRYGIC